MTGEELRKRREELRLTQAELGKRLGLSRLSILRYEKGLVPVPKMVEYAMREIEREA
jgi:transcriptional regulator with XRE-family HTH domain